MKQEFQRHFDACNNAVLPGDRTRLLIGTDLVGWLEPRIAAALLERHAADAAQDGLVLRNPTALPGIAQDLAEAGFYRFRNEAFDVKSAPDGPALSTIDRGALPAFGVMAEGVHLNGLVRRPDGMHLWVARRAADKALDPGKLDHLAAGGVSAGMGPWETLIKESGEEAAISAELASQAKCVGKLSYSMMRPEGLRRDLLHCYDLDLPEDFIPCATDGEVESFELWPVSRVYAAVRDTDDFKFNVSLVLIDLFGRLGML